MSTLKYHGLYINDLEHGEIRFGIVELIGRRQSWLWSDFPRLTQEQRKSIQRFNNHTYRQCASKCRDTALKLIHALYKLSNSLIILEGHDKYCYDGAPMETAAIYFQAIQDTPYHLDAFISYLRIIADCISFALPFFYETKKSIPNRGYREHLKWFTKTTPSFDPEYTSILQRKTKWFELLAGKADPGSSAKGIRDLNFHNFATYQIGGYILPIGHHEVQISQVTSTGIANQNVLSTLEDLLDDFFQYLDCVYDLFIGRFRSEIPEYDWYSPSNSILMSLEMPEIRSKYRLFPLIS